MKVATTISIDKHLLSLARGVAKTQKRSLSAQLEQWLEERFAQALSTGPATTAAAATGRPGETPAPSAAPAAGGATTPTTATTCQEVTP